MQPLLAITTLLGGIGLFLVGMWLMTDGLKLAAGQALRDLLHSWTNTRVRGLGTGFMITGLVQSSSAVTVATIGFANAGLLTLEQAIWVIFGSNVGTTMTGWLVVLIGFKVNIEFLALPLIGIGMFLRLTGIKARRAAIGQALVGFGLFFLGISVLQEGFTAYASGMSLPPVRGSFFTMLPVYVGIGLILTTLMQSSSAAMVITLSAAASGLIPLGAAAAVVIGTNLGTTTTSLVSVIGATATAKRVAASHVMFNLITAFAAVLILIPMLEITTRLQALLHLPDAPATTLALFHTVFNILGVLLVWPVARRLTRVLKKRFVTLEEIAGRPAYLDDTSLAVPAVAAEALLKELERLGIGAVRSVHAVLDKDADFNGNYPDPATAESLGTAIADYVSQLNRTDMPENVARTLPTIIQITQQYVMLCNLAVEVMKLQGQMRINDPELKQGIDVFKGHVSGIFDQITGNISDDDIARMQSRLDTVESEYESLKAAILESASRGELDMTSVDIQLQINNLIRRMARQIIKAVLRLHDIRNSLSGMVPADSGKMIEND
ncbi:MAG: Na/Pi symporter [Gammaproteobacteria bacterium]